MAAHITTGWIIPPPMEPSKSRAELQQERASKVLQLIADGLIRSERIRSALLTVPREDFIPPLYRDYAYQEVPLPLPGTRATISCPHSYPLFYEPLGLDEGQRFLEVGLGSGYGAAVAREVVGPDGLVVSMELDPVTYAFGKTNLERAGYRDVLVILGDGGMGHPEQAPYDRICLTASCREIPPPLVEQLKLNGRLIVPLAREGVQQLTLLVKQRSGVHRQVICDVLYIPLQGRYASTESE